MEFAYDGGGLGKGGDVTLYVDGGKVGEGHVELTQPLSYSIDETLDIGYESGTPSPRITPCRRAGSPAGSSGCSSTRGLDDHDHLISPEERLRVALARH